MDGETAGHVRSFNARQGRRGPQLRTFWSDEAPAFFMPAGRWELPARTVLEIGSGMGDSLLAAARQWDLAIGVDVHVRGLAATVHSAMAAGLDSLRVVQGDAIEVLDRQVPEQSLDEIHVWFPDPWPKVKHRKRRLIRPAVADLFVARLVPGGVVRLATDVPAYAALMREVLSGTDGLAPLGVSAVVPRPGWRPITRYEGVGLAAGRPATELAFRRR